MPPNDTVTRHVSNSFIRREFRTRRYTFLTVVGLGVALVAFFFAFAAYGSPQKKLHSTLKQLHVDFSKLNNNPLQQSWALKNLTSSQSTAKVNQICLLHGVQMASLIILGFPWRKRAPEPVFRHGDRTPSFSFPNDPNGHYEWPDGIGGSLTNRGKSQMYQLGKNIRRLYNKFLTDAYNASWIRLTSSNSPRTQMSALTFVAALYPPKGSQIWNEELNWQPIPVNAIPRSQDNLLACKAPCKAFDEEKSKSDVEFNSTLTEQQKYLFKQLTEYTGSPINSVSDVATLYYTLFVERDHGLPIPQWAQTLFPQIVKFAAADLDGYTRNDILKKFQAGPMITQWIQHMTDASTGHTTVKAHFYSGHDLTIDNLVRTLGVQMTTDFLPEYGATLLVELHQKAGTGLFHVRFAYLNSSEIESPVTLKMRGCQAECPWEEFINQMKPYVIKDWEKECGN